MARRRVARRSMVEVEGRAEGCKRAETVGEEGVLTVKLYG